MKIKKQTVLFQMDPLEKLDHNSDSTIIIILEALKRNFDVWIGLPNNLTLQNCKAKIFAQPILNEKLELGDSKLKDIEKLDFYFIRQDPPFNQRYLTNCYMLEVHQKFNKKPFFVNNPGSIKNFTEKIFPLYFQKYMPDTVLTENVDLFLSILEKYKRLVIKTLYNKGGEGVEKVTFESKQDAVKSFKKIIKRFGVPCMVQEYKENIIFGDKRVILVDGNPVGAVNRIPKKGEFKANLHLGGLAKKTHLTNKEYEICNSIKEILVKEQLFFVGIDIIDEKLTEINVTSPTGISQINNLDKINIAEILWDTLLNKK
ncbi:MAG: glutathione synthase [Alphaproteobacteria bacterium]|tara:strand:+ start:227 stop:1171 length:945 start_codon:yes stop_codon:yes gene_type:complete